jgi:uncharacterized repeat protein (TIGR01451 family)
VDIAVQGFRTPPAGPFTSHVGIVSYEGDRAITGDFAQLNGRTLSDGCHPANNFFNSTICDFGARVTDRSPSYDNTLGFDAAHVDASGFIPNGATGATVHLGTSGDTYFPTVITTEIDIFAPNVQLAKSVTGASGPNGQALRGDTLTYTIAATSNGRDPATNVTLTDPIPAHTTFVPGSLMVTNGPNAGPKTDAPGDDQAEFGAGRVTFRLGTGANAVAGGRMDPGQSSTVSFQVTVSDDTSDSTVIRDLATASFVGLTSGSAFSSLSNPADVTVHVPSIADIGVVKSVEGSAVRASGQNATFAVVATNHGPDPGTNIVVTDPVPAGLTLVSASPGQGSYNPATGAWSVGSLGVGQSTTLRLVVTSATAGQFTNTATKTSEDQEDNNTNNDTSSAVVLFEAAADLSITKQHDSAPFPAGGSGSYTITVHNAGPDAAAAPVTVTDVLPAGLTFTGSSGAGWTCTPADQQVTCTLATALPSGQDVALQLEVAVAADASGTLRNQVLVASPTFDGTIGNNMATDDVPIAPRPSPPSGIGFPATGHPPLRARHASPLHPDVPAVP